MNIVRQAQKGLPHHATKGKEFHHIHFPLQRSGHFVEKASGCNALKRISA